MDLAVELQKIYDSEINVSISWLWDGGVDVRLGDAVNGFLAEERLPIPRKSLPGCNKPLRTFTPTPPTPDHWIPK